MIIITQDKVENRTISRFANDYNNTRQSRE